VDRVPLAHPTLFRVLSAQRTPVTHKFSWVDGCAAYNRTLYCRWVPALLCHGYPGCICHARPPIHSQYCLLPPCSFHLFFLYAHHLGVIVTHSASSIAPCRLCSMIEVPQRLTKSSSFVASLFDGYCRTSVAMHHSDLSIMLQLSVVTSWNWFCHHSISSPESEVQELSRSHEILSSAMGFT